MPKETKKGILAEIALFWPWNDDRRDGFESQNQSFMQTEQLPDGSLSVITAGFAESALLDNKNPSENTLFCSIKWKQKAVQKAISA